MSNPEGGRISSTSQFSGDDVVGDSEASSSSAMANDPDEDPATTTTLESLKNTPSNIAKLEDAIEHHEGRKKYLPHTKSPSDGGDVRWYFCKTPLLENQFSASVPQTAIVGKGEYFRFGMRDSLALEASFLQQEEDLLAKWWGEYAECTEGPASCPMDAAVDSKGALLLDSDGHVMKKLLTIEEERFGVPVKGGLFEVDLVKRHCFPVYWHGEHRRVLRGHWFGRKGGGEWLPISEDVAEQIEIAYSAKVWHRRCFQPSGLFAARVDIQSSSSGLHALFTGEDDTWEAWLGFGNIGFSNVIGLRGNNIKLRRGYAPSGSTKPNQDELRQQREEEMDDYCSQVPVGHLVFMVHGIGQRLEKSNLVDDVATFRHVSSRLADRHLTSYQRSIQRVLFIPCQWRKGLRLDGEGAVDRITLDGVRGLREVLGATVHDVLYYMSPIYCQDIINSVSNQLNRLYMKFLKRNPGYSGKVSIYGHSLGSVLSYDILCHQEMLPSPVPVENCHNDGLSSGDALRGVTPVHSMNNSVANLAHITPNRSPQISEKLAGYQSDQDNPINKELEFPAAEALVTMSSGPKDISAPQLMEIPSERYPEDQASKSETLGEDQMLKNDKVNTVNDVSSQTSETEKLVETLRKEVDMLKGIIEDLKARLQSAEGDMVDATTSEALLPDKDSSIIKYIKLDFKVDTFFSAGSPLGVFLALRNVRLGIGKGQEYWKGEGVSEELPACQRMFNIFHPFDPVAYRVEPLVCKEYITRHPVIIPFHKGGKRLHVGVQDFGKGLAAQSQAVLTRFNSMKAQMVKKVYGSKLSIEDSTEESQDLYSRTYGSLMIERLTGTVDGRIDYMLQDSTFQHPLISALQSHTSYWGDLDTALFILKHLYQDVPEDPDPDHDDQPNAFVVREFQRSATYPYCSSGSMNIEDLPLTFSDRELIREFSRSARKAMVS